jgi:hypothetical protein
VRPQRRSLVFALLTGTALLVDVSVFSLGRWLNALRAQERFWVVAEYREPWAVACLVCAIALATLGLWHATRLRRVRLAPRVALAGLACIVSTSMALELGMGISFEYTTGEFEIAEAVWTRTALRLPSTVDGVCARADLHDFFTWRLNGIAVHPRLLPLPLNARDLTARLAAANCGH